MTGILPFIPKEDQRLPDSYSVTIHYVTGIKETFDLASHSYSKDTGMLEFWTKHDLMSWVPMSSVRRIEFDKNFTEIISIKNEMSKKVEND